MQESPAGAVYAQGNPSAGRMYCGDVQTGSRCVANPAGHKEVDQASSSFLVLHLSCSEHNEAKHFVDPRAYWPRLSLGRA